MTKPKIEAWNNFVMRSRASEYDRGTDKRSAALANLFMGLANSGGINSFLTCTYELDASEVLNALRTVGANIAAKQLEDVLLGIGIPLLASTPDDRWALLEEHWPDTIVEGDVLSEAADCELVRVLERHVVDYEDFYIALGQGINKA